MNHIKIYKLIYPCIFETFFFNRSTTQDEKIFEIFHATFANPKFQDYHRRLQTFIIWYIDAASYIDDEDHNWNLYTLFEKVVSCGEVRLVYRSYCHIIYLVVLSAV